MTTTAEKSAEEKAAAEKSGGPDKRRALGRGLESLLPGPRPVPGTAPATLPGAPQPAVIGDLQAQAARAAGDAVIQIPLDKIDRNPYQTRHFTKERADEDGDGETGLDDLAESIRANGVIQPVTVRPGKDGRYVLITGERRWKASKLAGKEKVPALVRQVSDQQAAEMTVVENLQRQDLNCMDQARAFLMLAQTFQLTQEAIGERVGLARTSVSNYMRLVKLPQAVQAHLASGALDYSHARLFLNIDDAEVITKAADEAAKKFLSVEQLEELLLRLQGFLAKPEGPPRGGSRFVDPNVRAAQRQLEQVLGMRVRIRDRKGKGKITIEYGSLEDFDRVVKMLRGK
ncbi:MAG TPA: ParB/RepB/Spo0J family partition protein [Terriglobales bacterium]|nr:ParB/RepB/Spo0J family partition protein [Terriglobales bacterium]